MTDSACRTRNVLLVCFFCYISMAFSFFKRLYAKPEREKRRIAFWSAVFLTGIILLLWVFSFRAVHPEGKISTPAERGPFSSLFQTMTDVIGETVYVVKKAKDNLFAPAQTVYPDTAFATKTPEK